MTKQLLTDDKFKKCFFLDDSLHLKCSYVTDKSFDLSFIEKETKEIVSILYLEDLGLYNSIVRSCNHD
jgi:hypothetical protein